MGKWLGIDYGEKRFGLALSDVGRQVARPLEVVEGVEKLWPLLEKLKEEENLERIIVGLPKNMDGTLGPGARAVGEFRKELEERLALPVEAWDERWTTVQAVRQVRSKA